MMNVDHLIAIGGIVSKLDEEFFYVHGLLIRLVLGIGIGKSGHEVSHGHKVKQVVLEHFDYLPCVLRPNIRVIGIGYLGAGNVPVPWPTADVRFEGLQLAVGQIALPDAAALVEHVKMRWIQGERDAA